MAGSTQELFDDEFTREVRDAYVRRRVQGVPVEEATEIVIYDHRYSALMSPAHAALLWLALAVTQWQNRELLPVVRDRATTVGKDDTWIRLWAESVHAFAARRAIVAAILDDLASPPPAAPPIQIEPLYLSETLDAAGYAAIAERLAALGAKRPAVDVDAAPESLVREVAGRLEDARRNGSLTEGARAALVESLGTLWGAQVVRLDQWEWATVLDAGGSRTLAAVRRDHSAFVSPSLHLSWYLDDPEANANVVESLFQAIRDDAVPRGESGALLPLRDFAYRLSDQRWTEQRAQLLGGTISVEPPQAPGNVALNALDAFDKLGDTSSCTISAPLPSSDGTDENRPPSPTVVARRALVLRSLLDHAVAALPRDLLARYASGWDAAERARYAPEALALSRQRVDALRSSGLWTDAEREEQTMLETPFTELAPPQLIATSWRAESLAVLLWALGRLDTLPPYDEPVNADVVLSISASEGGSGFVLGAALRAHDEIERARTIAELWHWRSRTRRLQEEGRRFPGVPGFPVKSWDDVVRYTAPQAVVQGFLERAVDEDFPAFGRAYRDLSATEWAQARSIAQERHFALNWLCGYAPGNRWSETPTDT